jgi:hypothetical protein
MLNLTTYDAALKNLYPDGLSEILYEKCPLFGWLPKDKNFKGKSKTIVPMYEGNRVSNTFEDARQDKSDISLVEFTITRAKMYGMASLDAETIAASADNMGALAKAIETQVRGVQYGMERAFAHQIYGNGFGTLATGDGSWTVSGTTVTVSDKRDLVHISKGIRLEAIVAAETSKRTGGQGWVEVASVNRSASTFTTTVAVNSVITDIANTDKFIRKGTYNNCIKGLQAWLPPGGVTATPFFGVDRTLDADRLGGVHVTATAVVLEEAVLDAVGDASVQGCHPTDLFINSKRFYQMAKSMHSKAWVDVESTNPNIGYRGLGFATDYGDINVIPDPNCPYAYGFLLDRDSWELCSLGDTPHFAMDDGQKFARETDSDGIEFRVRSFHQLTCDAPGHNAIITWAS